MENSLILDVGLVLGRVIIGGMLILAGILKLKAGPNWFLRQVLAYELVSGRAASWLAQLLPWAEIGCGVLLLVGFLTPLVTMISFVLLWGFTATVVSTFLRGKQVDCGCFGRSNNTRTHRTRWIVIYRNLGLMAILVVIYTAAIAPFSIDTRLNEWPYFNNFDASIARWLAIIWGCSFILAVTLQFIIRKRLLSAQSPGQTLSSTHSN